MSRLTALANCGYGNVSNTVSGVWWKRPVSVEHLVVNHGSHADANSNMILLVTDLFQPINRFAVQLFLNGDMRHGCGGQRAVPMLFSRRELDHVARPDLLNRAAPALRQTAARRHDERLAEQMRMPGRPRAGLKRDAGADRACRSDGLKQRVNAHRAGEPIRRTFPGRLRAASFDFHSLDSFI
jgi:hypothetical protein